MDGHRLPVLCLQWEIGYMVTKDPQAKNFLVLVLCGTRQGAAIVQSSADRGVLQKPGHESARGRLSLPATPL